MTSVSRLRDVLTRASTREAPEINPDFADQLEQRLRMLAGGPVPKGGTGDRAVRRPPWHAAAALAVAAAAVAAVVVSRDDGAPSRVSTLDEITTPTTAPETSTTVTTAPTTTTSSTAPATTTTVAPIAITTTTAPPAPATTTTARPATTTTTRPEPTTSTTAPSSTTTTTPSSTTTTTVRPTTTTTTSPTTGQNLAMTCQVTAPSTVTCRWAQSTSGDFNRYRMLRKANGQETVLIDGDTNRARQDYVDTTAASGVTYQYGIQAFDRSGKLVGQGGPVSITCC